MQIIKKCGVCGINIGKYVCIMCGKLVCENCYDKKKGLCISCAQGKRIR